MKVQFDPADPAYLALQATGFSASASATPTASAYLAGDVMGALMTFANIGPEGGGEVELRGSELLVAHTALVASEAGYDLHLYSAAPTEIADNAAWDLPAGDRALYLGKLALGTVLDLGSTVRVEVTNHSKQITVPAGGDVYGYLVTLAGITPTAAARTVTLKARRP